MYNYTKQRQKRKIALIMYSYILSENMLKNGLTGFAAFLFIVM